MVDGDDFLIQSRAKEINDAIKLFDWFDENNITYTYSGGGRYWFTGKEDATKFKLVWG